MKYGAVAKSERGEHIGIVRHWSYSTWFIFGAGMLYALPALAAPYVAVPDEGQFIRDEAALLGPEYEAEIHAICMELYQEADTPLMLVTMNSMGDAGGGGQSIESFARLTFEQWGAAGDFPYTDSWRRGMLLLIAYEDRKARIELGRDWRGKEGGHTQRVMEAEIIPRFRRERYAAGILAGVQGLDRLARGETQVTWNVPAAVSRLLVVLSFFVLLGCVFYVIGQHLSHNRYGSMGAGRGLGGWDDGGTGYRGGYAGGGFGGGGGATGTW